MTLISMLLSFQVSAKGEKHILQCLGKEEEYFSLSKMVNSEFQLNQLFINELTSLPRFTVKEGQLSKLCNVPQKTSHKLLHLMIEQGPSAFEAYDPNSFQVASLKDGIDQFFANIPEFFLQYISSLQVYAPTANCLEVAVPEIKKYLAAINAGRSVEGYDPYLDQKKNMLAILNKTENIEKIYKKCVEKKSSKKSDQKK